MLAFTFILLFPLALCYNMKAEIAFRSSLGSGTETLESVTELFESSYPDGRCTMSYEIVCRTRKPDVFDYLMSKVTNTPGSRPGEYLRELLAKILDRVADNFKSGDEDHQMIRLCLKWCRHHNTGVARHPHILERNIIAGNFEVVKDVFDSGFVCGTSFLDKRISIKSNQAEMIDFFLEQKQTLEHFGPTVAEMIISGRISPDLMEKYLANGLPLDYEENGISKLFRGDRAALLWYSQQVLVKKEKYNFNYFELSLKQGNLPLAIMMYSLGLRIDTKIINNAASLKFAIMPEKFARYLACLKNFEKIEVLLAGTDEQRSGIDGLPVDIVMRVIAGHLNENVDDQEINPALLEMVADRK